MPVHTRDQFLLFIQVRLHRYEQWHVPSDILDDELRSRCLSLLELLGPRSDDLEAVHAVALVFWYRALLQPEALGEEQALALSLFAAIHPVAPQRVPDLIRDVFVGRAPDPDAVEVMPEQLEGIVLSTFQRAHDEENTAGVTQCIELMERVLRDTPRARGYRAQYASDLSAMYYGRHGITRAVEDLDAAVSWGLDGAQDGRPDHPQRAWNLFILSHALYLRHRLAGDPDDLEAAVETCRLCLGALPREHQDRPHRLAYLAELLTGQHRLNHRLDTLDEAVGTAREACADDRAPRALRALRDALQQRFDLFLEPQDINEILDLDARLLDAAPAGGFDEFLQLITLIQGLEQHEELLGSDTTEGLDSVVQRLRVSVTGGAGERQLRSGRLLALAVALGDRFMQTGAEEDLADARALIEEAASLAEETDPFHELITKTRRAVLRWTAIDGPSHASILGQEAHHQAEAYMSTRELSRLNRAIALGLKARELTQTDDDDHQQRLLNLAGDLLSRYHATDRAEDVYLALVILDELHALPLQDQMKGPALNMRSAALADRFKLDEDRADLERSIADARRAVDAEQLDSSSYFAHLNSLAAALMTRYRLDGDRADADQAVAFFRTVVDDASPDAPSYRMYLGNLAQALKTLSESTQDMDLLSESIDLFERAVEPSAGLRDSRHAGGLGDTLMERHARTGRSVDLIRAAEVYERALAATPVSHPLYRALQAGLRHSQRLINRRDKDLLPQLRFFTSAAIEVPEEEAGAEVSRDRAHELSLRLAERYEATRDVADLDRAIRLSRQAAAPNPDRRTGGRDALAQLATLLVTRIRASESHADQDVSLLDEAIDILRRLLNSAPVGGAERVGYLCALGSALSTRHRITGDPTSLNEAVGFYSRVAHDASIRSSPRIDSARWAGRLCARAGQWNRATDFLEFAVDLHSRTAAEELGDEDQQYELISRSGLAGDAAACALELGDVERAVALLEQGRGVLYGRTDDSPVDLAQAAERGPIVYLTGSPLRCDAILLTADGPTVLHLPDVNANTLATWVTHIQVAGENALNKNLPVAEQVQLQPMAAAALADLWDKVVGPILDRLGITGPPSRGTPPRIWWIPTSLFIWLPLHAAGHPNGQSALDRVISSYALSLRALSRARRQAPVDADEAGDELLVVCLPNIPGHPELALPQAQREADMLLQHFPRARLLGTCDGAHAPATPGNILTALPQYSVVHLACHTHDDWRYPLASRITVEPGQRETLTVKNIAELRLEHTRLAYLSACSTARTATTRLIDEALHPVAAFQEAGFPHVIGTLWEIGDKLAADFAADCYATMSPEPNALAPSLAPYAVHHATLTQRERFPTAPTLWASHIHVGP
ncbi:CHAT domain-containing protein [Streptomyces cupreus]|uniref:CHAT domain-containing protein n=1 Tax=Streptomyces cupreus TaxID=2759956 RepID=A0A7X1J251_9ACTN|nr:CHAT domain-containing protein [Streptomyces cupreus]MBC2902150.1 CHAT domain-containing protein [Streptomyces cupreus]